MSTDAEADDSARRLAELVGRFFDPGARMAAPPHIAATVIDVLRLARGSRVLLVSADRRGLSLGLTDAGIHVVRDALLTSVLEDLVATGDVRTPAIPAARPGEWDAAICLDRRAGLLPPAPLLTFCGHLAGNVRTGGHVLLAVPASAGSSGDGMEHPRPQLRGDLAARYHVVSTIRSTQDDVWLCLRC